jgi:hypothetical protein
VSAAIGPATRCILHVSSHDEHVIAVARAKSVCSRAMRDRTAMTDRYLGIPILMPRNPRTDAKSRTEIAQRRTRQLVLVVTVLTCVAACAGAFAGDRTHKGGIDVATLLITFVLICAVLGAGAIAGIKLLNRHMAVSQLMGWDLKTRLRVGKSLRRGDSIPAPDQELAHSLLGVWERQRWMGWLYVGLGVCSLVGSIGVHDALRWMDLALSLCYLTLAPYWVHLRRKVLRNAVRDASGLDT